MKASWLDWVHRALLTFSILPQLSQEKLSRPGWLGDGWATQRTPPWGCAGGAWLVDTRGGPLRMDWPVPTVGV